MAGKGRRSAKRPRGAGVAFSATQTGFALGLLALGIVALLVLGPKPVKAVVDAREAEPSVAASEADPGHNLERDAGAFQATSGRELEPGQGSQRDAGELLATAARLGAERKVTSSPRVKPGRPAPEKQVDKGSLIIIIDDAGYDLRALDAFLALPFPLTIAVLPGLPHSAEAARKTLLAGKELILHQPMEALGGEDPGPGALLLSMKADEATRIVQENLDSLPGVLGLNNHMGSALTRDHELMVAVLELAKARGIYYVDSLTASGTVTKVIARSESMTTWERSVFLDNSPEKAMILRAISEGKKKAETGSPAIMIGHVWSQELATTLQELYPMLAEEGFSLSTIARLMLEEAHARSRN